MKKKLLCFIFLFFIPTAPVLAHTQTVIIDMTKDGFVPQDVTIDENTTLNFINKDTVDRWPASDVHPTHQIYPEFDPKKPIKPGEFWLFKPKRIGTFKLHDHLFPHKRGQITIAQEGDKTNPTFVSSSPIASASSSILNWSQFLNQIVELFIQGLLNIFHIPKPHIGPSPSPLLQMVTASEFKTLTPEKQQEELKKLARSQGTQATWKYIVDTYNGEAATQGNIHDLAHFVGELLYEEKGFPGLATCTAQFAFGCFHGFLDTAFKDNLDHLIDAQTSCDQLGKTASGPVASCIHGIGHGVASFYQTRDLKTALIACDRLTSPNQPYCYDGVFMEFERNAATTFYKDTDLLYPCTPDLSPVQQFACGRNQPNVLMDRFHKSVLDVITLCMTSTNKEFKSACVDAIGFSAVARGNGDPRAIIGDCTVMSDEKYKAQCLRAAAGELIFQEIPNWEKTSTQICQATSINFQQDCFTYIQKLILDYGRTRKMGHNEDVNAYVRSQMQICFQNGGRDSCYEKVANLFSEQFPLKQTLSVFAANENYPEIYARCHEVTHYLSRNEYRKIKSVPAVYSVCDSTCHGGCYHGTLEAYLKDQNVELTDSHIGSIFIKICEDIKGQVTPLVYFECLHGLGHAAMFITDQEVPQSLKLCDALGDTESSERCYSGVFMENSSSSTNNDHPGKYVKVDDPFYPCNGLEEKYQRLCYRYQSSYFALIVNHDWTKVANLCLQVPPTYQIDCFRTIGTNQVGFTQDLHVMKTNCLLMPENFQGTCIGGVIGSLVYRFVGDMTKMIEFCGLVDSGQKPNCFRQIGSGIADWSIDPKEKQKFCDQIPDPAGKQWCQNPTQL